MEDSSPAFEKEDIVKADIYARDVSGLDHMSMIGQVHDLRHDESGWIYNIQPLSIDTRDGRGLWIPESRIEATEYTVGDEVQLFWEREMHHGWGSQPILGEVVSVFDNAGSTLYGVAIHGLIYVPEEDMWEVNGSEEDANFTEDDGTGNSTHDMGSENLTDSEESEEASIESELSDADTAR